MAKRRLSDLLKEESANLEGSATAASRDTSSATESKAVEATPTSNDPDLTVDINAEVMTDSKDTAVAPEKKTTGTAKSAKPAASKAPASKRRTPTKADLEKELGALKTQLSESKGQLEDLQAQLNDRQGYVEELKGYLEKANDLKAELDKTQKAMAQLEEENAQLKQDLAATQQPSQPKKLQNGRPNIPVVPVSKSRMLPAVKPPAAKERPQIQRDQAPYGRRPVGPTANPSQDGEDFSKQTWLL